MNANRDGVSRFPDGDRHAYRCKLYRETLYQALERWIFGTHFLLKADRLPHIPRFLWSAACDLMRGGTVVPDPKRVVACPELMGGVCRNISADTILEASRFGFDPWCHYGPLKWWTRDMRMVLFFNEHHMGKNLRRDMRNKRYSVTFDEAFEDVVKACASRRSYRRHGLTWITPRIMMLYTELYDRGHAHSFEVWSQDGRLVGGGFGHAFGRIFSTESLFSFEPNTSKMGFATLNYHLNKWGYVVNDAKAYAANFDAMGFRVITRAEYDALLSANARIGGRGGPWSVEHDLKAVSTWQSEQEKKKSARL